jgi:hypothetical protein
MLHSQQSDGKSDASGPRHDGSLFLLVHRRAIAGNQTEGRDSGRRTTIARIRNRSPVTDLDTAADHEPREPMTGVALSLRNPSARRDSLLPRCRGPVGSARGRSNPVPTGAELVRAQVRTVVAQYPPTIDDLGV